MSLGVCVVVGLPLGVVSTSQPQDSEQVGIQLVREGHQ